MSFINFKPTYSRFNTIINSNSIMSVTRASEETLMITTSVNNQQHYYETDPSEWSRACREANVPGLQYIQSTPS